MLDGVVETDAAVVDVVVAAASGPLCAAGEDGLVLVMVLVLVLLLVAGIGAVSPPSADCCTGG